MEDAKRGFWKTLTGGVTERDARNSRNVNTWLFVWMACWVTTSLLISSPGGGAYAGIAVTTALGVAALLAYVKFLREAEELQRKIQLEALALGFGAALVSAVVVDLMSKIGAWGGGPSDLILPMMAGYAVGIIRGFLRYR